MVQRSKRSLSAGDAERMRKELRAFHHQVRVWCGEVPIGGTVYVSLDALNSALVLTDCQVKAAIDGAAYEWPAGKQGLP